MSFERILNWMKPVHLIASITRFRKIKEKLKDVLNASRKKIRRVTIKLVQRESFNKEYTLLPNNEEMKNGRLKELCPFLDENDITQ